MCRKEDGAGWDLALQEVCYGWVGHLEVVRRAGGMGRNGIARAARSKGMLLCGCCGGRCGGARSPPFPGGGSGGV